MSQIKVTVTMPAYNVANYVEDAIESVLAQDFDAFELIIIDDGSSDGTCDRLACYTGPPRVRLAHHTSNQGSGFTRNRILELARGEYLLPCDADDLLLPGALQNLSQFLDDNDEFGVVYGDILRLETAANTLQDPPSIVGVDANNVWDLFENAVNHGGSMMRTDLVRQVGGYAVGSAPDDWGLFLKLAEITRIHYLKGFLYYVWRLNDGSQSRSPANFKTTHLLIEAAIDRRAKRQSQP